MHKSTTITTGPRMIMIMRLLVWLIALHGLHDIVCGMTLLMGMPIPQSFMFRPRLTPYESFMFSRCLMVAGFIRMAGPKMSGLTYCLDTICSCYLVMIGRVAFWRGMQIALPSVFVATLLLVLFGPNNKKRKSGPIGAAKRASAAYFA